MRTSTKVLIGAASIGAALWAASDSASGLSSGSADAASEIARAYKLPRAHAEGIATVARRLGTDPFALANLINFETAGSFSPSKRNPHSGATGLVQFMPSTAQELGTTTDELARLSFLDQLPYVERYLRGKAAAVGGLQSPHRLAMAVFFPAAAKFDPGVPFADIFRSVYRAKGDEWIARYTETFARQNPGIDTPADYSRFLFRRAKLPTTLV